MNVENNNQEMLELLSAYLDDELTEGQRDRVEQMLAEDVRARSLLQNLRDASDAVSGLGVEEIPRDISDEVLYALERDTLLDGNEDMAVMAGERHLRMRQFMGAAGIMILVGAVVVVVYGIMKNPGIDESGTGPLAINDVKEKVAADAANDGAVNGLEDGSNVVRFESFSDMARSLAKKDKGEETEIASTMAADAVDQDIAEADIALEEEIVMPELPPMKEFVLPEAKWGAVKLASEIDSGDVVVIERLKNLVGKYGGNYLSGSGAGAHSFAFVCKADDFDKFYVELRDVLAGGIDLVLDGQDEYKQIRVKSVTGEEVGTIAKLADAGDQLGLVEMIVPGGRMEYVENEKVDDRPLWAQMADIVPEEYRVDFGDKLKEYFETYKGSGAEAEEKLVANAKVSEDIAEMADDNNSILARATENNKAAVKPKLMRAMVNRPIDDGQAGKEKGTVLSAERVAAGAGPAGGFTANAVSDVQAVEEKAEKSEGDSAELVVKADNVDAVEEQIEVMPAAEPKEKASKVKADYIAVEIFLTVSKEESEDEAPVRDGEIDGRIDFGF